MDATSLILAGLVPQGPLHPKLVVIGVVAGIAAAAIAGRSEGRWSLYVLAAAGLLVVAVQGDVLWGGVVDREDRRLVVGATVAVVAASAAVRPRWSTALIASIGACAGVWTIVPDTEVALLVGSVLVGATALRLLPGWMPDRRGRLNGSLLLLPLVGAAAGSIGRTARYEPALVVGSLGVLLSISGWTFVRLAWRRQRAGTPTTLVPGPTSSTTTAPAPTTAS